MKKWFLIILLMFPLMGFAHAIDTYGIDDRVITVESTDPHFKIELPSNPSTGYTWSVMDYDKEIIHIKNHYLPDDVKRLGAPGMSVWEFQIDKKAFENPHDVSITMTYGRAWEKAPVEEVKYIIRLVN